MEDRRFDRCEICKTYHFSNEKCPDVFYFKHEDWGDEFQEIRAHTQYDAALEFAEKYNQDDHVLMNHPVEVIISDGKKEIKYKVSAELDIHYSAYELK